MVSVSGSSVATYILSPLRMSTTQSKQSLVVGLSGTRPALDPLDRRELAQLAARN